jgi:hypothetical protein
MPEFLRVFGVRVTLIGDKKGPTQSKKGEVIRDLSLLVFFKPDLSLAYRSLDLTYMR